MQHIIGWHCITRNMLSTCFHSCSGVWSTWGPNLPDFQFSMDPSLTLDFVSRHFRTRMIASHHKVVCQKESSMENLNNWNFDLWCWKDHHSYILKISNVLFSCCVALIHLSIGSHKIFWFVHIFFGLSILKGNFSTWSFHPFTHQPSKICFQWHCLSVCYELSYLAFQSLLGTIWWGL